MPAITTKKTICLTATDEAQIAKIQANYAPYEIKTHHILRMALRQGLEALCAISRDPAQSGGVK